MYRQTGTHESPRNLNVIYAMDRRKSIVLSAISRTVSLLLPARTPFMILDVACKGGAHGPSRKRVMELEIDPGYTRTGRTYLAVSNRNDPFRVPG